jgi:hypothetical protein
MTEKRTTELRICVKQATEAVEYYLNNHLLRETVSVVSVEFVNKDDQFKIIIKEKEVKDAAP